MRALVLTALALIGCKKETPSAASIDAGLTAKTSTAAPDARDQYALLEEILRAKSGEPGKKIARSWIGKRYTWEASFVEPLCRKAAECYVVPFDHAKREEPILQGWLPSLALSAEEHQKLVAACRPHEECVLKFEGTMSVLDLTPGLPTRVGFRDARVVSVRPAREEERWGRRKRKGAPEGPQ